MRVKIKVCYVVNVIKIFRKVQEIQISGTIFCKECAESSVTERNIIARCNFCQESVFNNKLIHEVYENWGTQASEKLTVCQSCYKKWLKIADSKRKMLEMMNWFSNFSNFIMWFVLATITIDKNKEYAGKAHILLIIALSIPFFLLNPFSFLFIEKFAKWKYNKELKSRKRKTREKNSKK